jgi:hypothetical protein
VYLNGHDLGSVSSSQADAGWSAFLSLFPGGIASVQTWSPPAASTLSLIPGVTLSSIQEWNSSPIEPAGTIFTAGSASQVARHHASAAGRHTVKVVPRAPAHAAAAHAMTRAWDSGFAGHRGHR